MNNEPAEARCPATDQSSQDSRVSVFLSLAVLFLFVLMTFQLKGKEEELTGAGGGQVLSWTGGDLKLAPVTDMGGESQTGGHAGSIPPYLHPFFFKEVPINFADKSLLMTVSGIGPQLSREILRIRKTEGFFFSESDLLSVPGIGPKRMKQFAKQFSFSTEL